MFMGRNKSEHNCIFSPTKIIVLSSFPQKIRRESRKEKERRTQEYKEIKEIPKSNIGEKKLPLFLPSAC
jgi:hypothetical protein